MRIDSGRPAARRAGRITDSLNLSRFTGLPYRDWKRCSFRSMGVPRLVARSASMAARSSQSHAGIGMVRSPAAVFGGPSTAER